MTSRRGATSAWTCACAGAAMAAAGARGVVDSRRASRRAAGGATGSLLAPPGPFNRGGDPVYAVVLLTAMIDAQGVPGQGCYGGAAPAYYGNGNGYARGYGNGNGNGYSNGYGNGYSNGYGYARGYSNGYGNGYGTGNGSGYARDYEPPVYSPRPYGGYYEVPRYGPAEVVRAPAPAVFESRRPSRDAELSFRDRDSELYFRRSERPAPRVY